MTEFFKKNWPYALLLLLPFVAFGRSLHQGFAPLDDDLLVVHNLAIRGLTLLNIKMAFTMFDPELYIPLTFVSYQLNYAMSGLEPFGYHFTNLLLHGLNAILLWRILRKWIHDEWIAIAGALLFVLHPINTEAAVWIAARKDLLSSFFFFGSLLLYERWRESKRWNCIASVVLFTLGLLAKVLVAPLPLCLLLRDVLIEGRRDGKKMILEKIPYLLLGGAFVLVGLFGKERILSHSTPVETVLVACKSIVFYLEKIMLPINLGMFYPYQGSIGILEPTFLFSLFSVIALIALCMWSLKKTPWPAFGFGFFLIMLAPTFINFHKGGEVYFASDRYPYIAMTGLIAMLAAGVAHVSAYWHDDTKKIAVGGGTTVLAIAFLAGSMSQTKIWDSAESIFSHTLGLYPNSIAARVGLASIAKNEGNVDKAISLLRTGLSYADAPQLRLALGTAYAKRGDVNLATQEFNAMLAKNPEDPDALYALASLDIYYKNIDAAKDKLRRAIIADRSFVAARNKLAAYLIDEGKLDEAEEQLRAALKWNDSAEGAHYNLSIILDKQNKPAEALEHLAAAYALTPDNLDIALAYAEHLKAAGRKDEAVTIAKDVLRAYPDNERAKAVVTR